MNQRLKDRAVSVAVGAAGAVMLIAMIAAGIGMLQILDQVLEHIKH